MIEAPQNIHGILSIASRGKNASSWVARLGSTALGHFPTGDDGGSRGDISVFSSSRL